MIAVMSQRSVSLVAFMLIGFLCGCGGGSDDPDLGYVEGTVTLDSQPLPNARVIFQPEKGRPAYGKTDSNGYYEMSFSRDDQGAAVGQSEVTISTYQEGDPDAENDEAKKSQKEQVPVQYNEKTTLTADVKPGNNVFNFDLESKGEIQNTDEEQ